MPFGMVGRFGPRIKQADGVESALWERAILEVNVGRPIVTNRDFVAKL